MSKSVRFSRILIHVLVLTLLFSYSNVHAKPVTIQHARQVADTFLEIQKSTPVQNESVRERSGSTSRAPAESMLSHTRAVRGDSGQIIVYIHELDPEGFIITSADTDIRPVIGFSFTGEFPFLESKDNALLHLVKWDMETRLMAITVTDQVRTKIMNSNSVEWEKLVSQVTKNITRSQQWGPLLGTEWNQDGHFNNKVPYVIPYVPGFRRPVGCVATALAQILNYWEYPTSMFFSSLPWPEGDKYTSNEVIEIDEDEIKYGFPKFSELNRGTALINYNGDSEEEAYLNFATGVKLEMNYGVTESGAITSKAATVLKNDFSYGSAEKKYRSSGVWSVVKPEVIRNIMDGWPVQIGMHKTGKSGGHSVVLDGYRDLDDYIHINMGWGGYKNLWYDSSNIDSYDVIHSVVYDIAPYGGWHQYGADEKNTFRAKYPPPTTGPITNKWNVTASQGHNTFSGLVVGLGNKIYATLPPPVLDDNYPIGFWVINQYGDVEDRFTVPNDDSDVTQPVQDSHGYVYFASWEGKIYKYYPRTKFLELIYQNPSGKGFESLKIDSDNYLYAHTID